MRSTQTEDVLSITRDMVHELARSTEYLKSQSKTVISMGPSLRLAHAGIILFISSIILEMCNSYVPLFAFSSTMIEIMLVGGIVIFVLSSLCEILARIYSFRALAYKVDHIQERQLEILHRL